MKRALILTGKLVQDHEFIYPFYRLKEENFTVDVATEDGQETIGALGTKIPVNMKVEDVKPEEYDILVLPGGAKAMEYMRQNNKIIDIIREWDSKGKIIASICHASQLLISAKVVKGRKLSGYYSIKDDINNAGALYVDAPFVTDKNIITSPHYKHLGPWMKESLRVYNEKNDKSS
ncbi:MAG: DJ-1/PfpI/YhbO family deglycase/protease [Nanoarchaeota archaeon]|nr:DJ-1/PfpI/YhbO family deglycase/protease [Nanoarchaeota archaeon]